ncbi:MAG: hypothetical protein RBT76_02970 [candidate division Zixibacteria bacterium]|nr:hypothetical protein [candidate division Zixibacteria bacterium]
MEAAVPTENGIGHPHVGHCPTFTIIEVDPEARAVSRVEALTPPPHERGVIPA